MLYNTWQLRGDYTVNSLYYRDYVAGYVGLGDIPYEYWDDDIRKYALFKSPYIYYEKMLEYTLQGVTGLSMNKFLKSIPKKYLTFIFCKKLMELTGTKYISYIPKEYREKIKVAMIDTNDLVANFKYIPEEKRTPLMYRELSRLSFDDYLMYVVDYNGVPDAYRTREMCLGLFYGNIDTYIREIPNEYKSVELGKMLVARNFRKYFPILPEHCRTKEMYEEFVTQDPVNNIDKVPKDKRTQKMYDMLFDYTLDTYLKKIPQEFITKEMYHRLVRIDPVKYLHMVPTKYLDQDIAIFLLDKDPKYLDSLPYNVLTEDFFVGLIKKNPQKYLKILPEKYYTDSVITKIGNILQGKNIEFRLNGRKKLNSLILKKYPFLITQFTVTVFHDIIKSELIKMVNDGTDISDIVNKYHIKVDNVMKVLKSMQKYDNPSYLKIENYLNGDRLYLKYVNIDADLRTLEDIIVSLGAVSRTKITTEQKIKFAYLCKKYLTYSLEDIYFYNVSNRNKEPSKIVSSFIEYVLDYSIYADTLYGTYDVKKITYNNEWLKDFNYDKFFGIRDNVAHSKHFYGPKENELTIEIADKILQRLKDEKIPFNILIVNMAFRKYFAGEFDDFISNLHCFDITETKTKRKKR